MLARLSLRAFAAGFLLVASVTDFAGAVLASEEMPRIEGMRAHLFLNKAGEWSENVLDSGHKGLRNTIAGPNASNATLVVVEVSGPPDGTYNGHFGPRTKYELRLVATEGRKVLLNVTQTMPILSDQGKASLAFMVYQSGCKPVQLTATMISARGPKRFSRSLDFGCGE